jgi:hypothetical protein
MEGSILYNDGGFAQTLRVGMVAGKLFRTKNDVGTVEILFVDGSTKDRASRSQRT